MKAANLSRTGMPSLKACRALAMDVKPAVDMKPVLWKKPSIYKEPAVDMYIKDTKGPHGKKIKEGIRDDKGSSKEDSDGLQRALRAEPGSEDDPSRLAERQMLQGNSMGARGSGPRQSEVAGESMYDVLKNEVDS
jgi:hypothetical protein